MAIFNSYVKLPEGSIDPDIPRLIQFFFFVFLNSLHIPMINFIGYVCMMCIHASVYLLIYDDLSIDLSWSIYLSTGSIYLSTGSIYLSTGSVYLSTGSIHLSIYLSIYVSIYVSIYLSIYLSIHPSIHPSIYWSIRFICSFISLTYPIYRSYLIRCNLIWSDLIWSDQSNYLSIYLSI